MTFWGPDTTRLDLFHLTTRNGISNKYREDKGGKWQPSASDWRDIYSGRFSIVHEPAVTQWGSDNLVVFGVGHDNALHYLVIEYGKNISSADWKSIGGNWAAKPVVAAQYPHWISVVLIGFDNAMYHIRYDGTEWSDPENLGGVFVDPPSLVSWGPEYLDIFATGQDRSVQHNRWVEGAQWSGFDTLGDMIFKQPVAITSGPGHFDVFGIGEKGVVRNKHCDEGVWDDWCTLEGTWQGVPEVVSWGPGRLDLFLIGQKGREVYHACWTVGAGWKPAKKVKAGDKIARSTSDRVTAVAQQGGHIELFCLDYGWDVRHFSYSEGKGWDSESTSLGGSGISRIATAT